MRLRILFIALLSTLASFGAPRSIREVDFKNASYEWSHPPVVPSAWKWLSTIPSEKIKLKDGRYNFPNGPYLLLNSVTYGDLNGDGHEEAFVDLTHGGGGSANWHYLYAYSWDRGQPKLLAVLESGSRADGGLVGIKIEKGLLILDFLDGALRQGDCCSEGFIRVRYRWQPNHFAEAGVREKGKLRLREP